MEVVGGLNLPGTVTVRVVSSINLSVQYTDGLECTVVAQGEGSRGRGFLSPTLKQNSRLPINTDTRADGETARQRQDGWGKAWWRDQREGRRDCGGTRERGRKILAAQGRGSVDSCEQAWCSEKWGAGGEGPGAWLFPPTRAGDGERRHPGTYQ